MFKLVFGTEMMMITFLVLVGQALLSSFLLISMACRASDVSRKRFLSLTLFFMAYNFFGGLFPDKTIFSPMFVQYIFIYGTAIAMASYYFFYVSKEFEFEFSDFFNSKLLTISLGGAFLLTYVVGYLIIGEHKSAYYIFIGFPIVIAIYFGYKSVSQLLKIKTKLNDNTPFRLMHTASLVGVLLIAILPIESVLGGHQGLEIITVNTSFFLLAYAYIKRFIFNAKMEFQLLSKNGSEERNDYFRLFKEKLSTREREVLFYLGQQEKNYSDIANIFHVAPKTISKHASNIFKKAGVTNRVDLIVKFHDFFKDNMPLTSEKLDAKKTSEYQSVKPIRHDVF